MGRYVGLLVTMERDLVKLSGVFRRLNYPAGVITITRRLGEGAVGITPILAELEDKTQLIVGDVAESEWVAVAEKTENVAEYLSKLRRIMWEMCNLGGYDNPLLEHFGNSMGVLSHIVQKLQKFSEELRSEIALSKSSIFNQKDKKRCYKIADHVSKNYFFPQGRDVIRSKLDNLVKVGFTKGESEGKLLFYVTLREYLECALASVELVSGQRHQTQSMESFLRNLYENLELMNSWETGSWFLRNYLDSFYNMIKESGCDFRLVSSIYRKAVEDRKKVHA